MKDSDLVRVFLEKSNIFAVVGASRDPEKYGHKIYEYLKEAGYMVYPINPEAENIVGDKCYPSLKDLPKKPDVVDVVVPPEVTERIVEDCIKLGIGMVWMQPGSESEQAIKLCKENGIKVLQGICVMVETNYNRSETS